MIQPDYRGCFQIVFLLGFCNISILHRDRNEVQRYDKPYFKGSFGGEEKNQNKPTKKPITHNTTTPGIT